MAELVHVKHLEWELDFQRRSEELIAKALAAVPAPKDGKDGRDGLSLKDFDAITEDGGRTWTLSLTADETVIKRTLVTAMPLDRGVYSAGADLYQGRRRLVGRQFLDRAGRHTRPASRKPRRPGAWSASAAGMGRRS